MNYLGIDIGGTSVKYGIVTETGEILCTGEYPVAFDQYQTPILETVLKTSQEFLETNQYEPKQLEGIGISATGQIDTGKGIVAGVCGNIPNWEGAELKASFEQKYHLPVTVVNDANCVALGEKWIGAAADVHHAVIITIGTGVGGGIIINDEVLLGANGFAGEIGHFSIDRNGRTCTCGNRGCYEQYASTTALVRQIRHSMPLIKAPELSVEEINGKVIFELAEQGNEQINVILDNWISDIATGLISLSHIFNPEKIIIGGGVSAQEDLFIAKVREKVKQQTMHNFAKDLIIERAKLGNNAGLVGAVYYFREFAQK